MNMTWPPFWGNECLLRRKSNGGDLFIHHGFSRVSDKTGFATDILHIDIVTVAMED